MLVEVKIKLEYNTDNVSYVIKRSNEIYVRK